jgi:hypothetical protein
MLAMTAVLGAEIIDRIAVTLGNQVITSSDLEREIRVSAFLNREKPDLSPAAKRKTADRMVQQRLVRREFETSRFPIPELSEVEPILQKFQQEHFKESGAYQRALAEAGISEKEVREQILWQLTLLRFIEVRFRPGVQVSDEDVEGYFEKVTAPAARAAKPGETPSLDDYREQVVETLTQHQVNKDLDAWIAEARKRVGVEYRKEVFGQ